MPAQASHSSAARRAFTLLELVVVLAILAVLCGLLLPALAASKSGSPRVQCMNNLKQVTMGCLLYAADNNETFPTMKWRALNMNYSYEMMRFTSVNNTNSGYDIAGGPYNFGLLWTSRIIADNRVYYCPGRSSSGDAFTYEFYGQVLPWPYGENVALSSNPGRIRAGYYYMPQLLATTNLSTLVGNRLCPDLPPAATANPEKTWIALQPIKQTAVDVRHSMVTDLVYGTLNSISHRDADNAWAGMNAAFPDGHVTWQGANRVPAAFDTTYWNTIIQNNNGDDLRYIMSLFQP